jgi:hypothetical protein
MSHYKKHIAEQFPEIIYPEQLKELTPIPQDVVGHYYYPLNDSLYTIHWCFRNQVEKRDEKDLDTKQIRELNNLPCIK